MKRNLLLALACVCLLAAGCAKSDENAMDTLKDPSGENSVSLGMAQTAVEERLGTGTLLGQTAEGETPQMETVSYGTGADYLVVVYQEGKAVSLGTYWGSAKALFSDTAQETPDQGSRWQTEKGLACGAALEDLQAAYPDGKYLPKHEVSENGSQSSQNLFQTRGQTGGLTFVLTDEGMVQRFELITLDYFDNTVGLP